MREVQRSKLLLVESSANTGSLASKPSSPRVCFAYSPYGLVQFGIALYFVGSISRRRIGGMPPQNHRFHPALPNSGKSQTPFFPPCGTTGDSQSE